MSVNVKARLRIDITLGDNGYCKADLSTGTEGASDADMQVMIGQALSVSVDTLLETLGATHVGHSQVQVTPTRENGGSDV